MDKDIDIWKQRNEILHKKVNRQMAEIKDLNKKSETIFDLARRFPNKTYRELEQYKDADRLEEAQQTPLTESQKSQEELEPIRKGVCVTGKLRKDREESNWFPDGITFQEKYEKEHKLRQEAEGELTIIKGIGNTSPEMKALKKEIKNLKWIKDHDYIFLVDENKKLHKEVRELKHDNKQLAKEIEGRVNHLRKSGL